MKPRLALSLGDPGGISYPVAARAVPEFLERAEIRLFGDPRAWRAAGGRGDLPFDVEIAGPAAYAAAPEPENGRVALESLAAAFNAVQSGRADALVTAPLNKTAVRRVQPDFTGHTEFLRDACGGRPVIMSFFSERFKVALHTAHLPLREVWDHLNTPELLDGLTRLDRSWRAIHGGPPRIGMAGLNPHAGEGGAFGREEIELLMPAVHQARAKGLSVSDPLPPDTLTRQRNFDIFYALYHDQGLIAAKSLPEEAAQVTLGLPFVRTSPDHGTGYDLAATPELANLDGMRAAFEWAIKLAAR